MRKFVNLSLAYALLGLASGVFFREFGKFNQLEDSGLGIVHGHLLGLGGLFFLLVLILDKLFSLSGTAAFRLFFATYNIGLPITILMMFARGILGDLKVELGKGLDASISGMAGIGHILVAIGLIAFLVALRTRVAGTGKAA